MTPSDRVTIGVPVYRGERFIVEALESIQQQTHRHIEVVISLDGPDPAAESLCAPFLKDSRFRLVVQPQRLGWVGNINWLMAQASDGFWYYHQQDDLVDRRYVEVLLEYALRTPDAAVVYCDITAFGTHTFTIAQPSVTGVSSARQLALLFSHLPAVAFRGLTRVEAIRHSGRIPENDVDNFAVDATWMSAIARSGDLHRVPAVLYRKRYHDGNEHMKWFTWPLEKRLKAWTRHCADMLDQAMLVDAPYQDRRLIWLAAVGRLVSPIASSLVPVDRLTHIERTSLLEGFVEHLRTARSMDIPSWLDSDWNDIEGWTRGFYWLPTTVRPPSDRTPEEAEPR